MSTVLTFFLALYFLLSGVFAFAAARVAGPPAVPHHESRKLDS